MEKMRLNRRTIVLHELENLEQLLEKCGGPGSGRPGPCPTGSGSGSSGGGSKRMSSDAVRKLTSGKSYHWRATLPVLQSLGMKGRTSGNGSDRSVYATGETGKSVKQKATAKGWKFEGFIDSGGARSRYYTNGERVMRASSKESDKEVSIEVMVPNTQLSRWGK